MVTDRVDTTECTTSTTRADDDTATTSTTTNNSSSGGSGGSGSGISGSSSSTSHGKERIRIGGRAGIDIEFYAELTRHSQSVNCVRFSPDGMCHRHHHRHNWLVVWVVSDVLGITRLAPGFEFR
jgi:hypothetical protein